jgi:hypothetical protein
MNQIIMPLFSVEHRAVADTARKNPKNKEREGEEVTIETAK